MTLSCRQENQGWKDVNGIARDVDDLVSLELEFLIALHWVVSLSNPNLVVRVMALGRHWSAKLQQRSDVIRHVAASPKSSGLLDEFAQERVACSGEACKGNVVAGHLLCVVQEFRVLTKRD